ncbi:hypothetical protein GDO81_014931 [Engystomops pustulosus]|uniref:Uncharacterized protein n=1 Tax=Engystomops pustulosus TaxID=76066 RepID=A0AAV7AQK0_ENGPU|nr:hypothetical protein GDO81_014931 [Engystomops pustulosus]
MALFPFKINISKNLKLFLGLLVWELGATKGKINKSMWFPLCSTFLYPVGGSYVYNGLHAALDVTRVQVFSKVVAVGCAGSVLGSLYHPFCIGKYPIRAQEDK